LHYLEKKSGQSLAGKKILELGSGAGHLGIALATLGSHVTCTERVEMGTLERLNKRITESRKKLEESHRAWGSIQACELEWGEEGYQRSQFARETQKQHFDLVVMSELVYDESTHEMLVDTLKRVCSPETVIYSIFCDRPFSFMFFVKLHDADAFEVQQISDDDVDLLGMQPDAKVCMHKIWLRPA